MEIFNVKDKLPDVECGSYLVYAPHSFPKNSRWLVGEYYADAKGFYSEADEFFMDDVTHWCELPKEPCEGQEAGTGARESNIPDVSTAVCKGGYRKNNKCLKYDGNCTEDLCDYWQTDC